MAESLPPSPSVATVAGTESGSRGTSGGSGSTGGPRNVRTAGQAGRVAIDAIANEDTPPKRLVGLLSHGNIGAVLDSLHGSGELGPLVKALTPNEQTRVLIPALQELRGQPPTDNRRGALKDIFDATPDYDAATLMLCLSLRFQIPHVGLQRENDVRFWESTGLRRAWPVLEALPPGHTEGNPDLQGLVRQAEPMVGVGTNGLYDPTKRSAVFQYDPKTIDTVGITTTADKGDPLYDKNQFDATVRHEVGHAVDTRLRISSGFATTPAGAGWKTYDQDNPAALLADVYRLTGVQAAAGFDSPQAKAVMKALLEFSMSGNTAALEAAEAHNAPQGAVRPLLPTPMAFDYDGEPAAEAEADKKAEYRMTHPVWHEPKGKGPAQPGGDAFWAAYRRASQLIRSAWTDSKSGVWSSGQDGGSAKAGGRVFFLDVQAMSWLSYDYAARAKKVSDYQFRSPMEWVAEAYAAYYDPSATPRGASLAARDPVTKAWFDEHVATFRNRAEGDPGPAKR